MTSYGDPLDTDLLPDALSEALARVIAQKDREWQMRLDTITAETRATIADLNRVIAEKGAEVFAFKAEMRERVDSDLARIPVALAALKNGEDADPNVAAAIAAKQVSDDLSSMIRAEVAAIGVDIKEMSEGFDARIDARISERFPDVLALVTSALDEAIVSRGVVGTPDVHKILAASIASIPSQLTEEHIRTIATEEAARVVKTAIPDLPDVVPLVDNAVSAAFVSLPIPKDGKSVDPTEVRRMVDEAVADLPVPKDGRNGEDGKDGESVPVDVVEKMISGHVEAAFATLPVPKDGHTPTIDELLSVIEPVVQRVFSDVPVPQNGRDGADGQNGRDAEPVTREQIAEVVKAAPELFDKAASRYLDANPPKDGRDGRDGKDGEAGKDAEPITKDQIVEAVLACGDALNEAVLKHLTNNPPPAGRDGRDGDPGTAGKDAEPIDYDGIQKFVIERIAEIPVPKDGKDGVELAGAFINREGSLVITLSNGSVQELGCVEGKTVDPTEIKEMIRSELSGIESKAPDVSEPVFSPTLLGMIDGANRVLAEPLVVRSEESDSRQPITINVSGATPPSPRPKRKKIHTHRDENGDLSFEVEESEI